MSTLDCCNRSPGNRKKHESSSNDTLNMSSEENAQTGDNLECLQVEDEESPLVESLTTNTVSESVILASLAEMTAQEMKEIIDWYKNNTINDGENRKSLPQRQCLLHNSLAQLNLRDDDEDDDKSRDTTTILEESPSMEISNEESSSRTSITTPKQAVPKLASGAHEALTQAKQVNELCSYTEYMAQVIQSLSSPEACEETDESPDPLKESTRIMSELTTDRSRPSESSESTRNLTDVDLQPQEIQHSTNNMRIVSETVAELVEQTSDNDDNSYAATGIQPQELSLAKSKIYASSRRQISQRRNRLGLVTLSMALLVLFLLVSWRAPVTLTPPHTTEEKRIDQEPGLPSQMSQRIEDSAECSPRGCDYLPWIDSDFCVR
jgi:hypothetical protein